MAQPLKVWSKFTVSKENEILQLRVVEASQDNVEGIADFLINSFIVNETISKATGVARSEKALEIYKSRLLESFKLPGVHMLVCCADNGKNEIGDIVGGVFLWLLENCNPRDVQSDSEELTKFLEVINVLKGAYHVMEELKVSKYCETRIVGVHPNYRRLGIAEQLFKVILQVCKEDGVPLTVGIMTAIGSQKAAEKNGWKTLVEIDLKEFGKTVGVTFKEDAPPQFKFMMARVDEE